jgi:acyl carrier protein
VSDRLIEVFSEVLGVPCGELAETTSPANTPQWDSLATINLTLGIEYEFATKFTTQEIASMNTIGAARAVLAKKGVLQGE